MKTVKLAFTAALTAAAFAASSSASANLIVNGGFEDNNVATGSWAAFDASAVNGWEGSRIEIWDHLNGVVAPEGNQHAELNADPASNGAFSIYQTFATDIGATYDVSFYYSARSSNSEAFSVTAGDLNALVDDHVVGQWSLFTGSFVANSTSSTLRFTSVNPLTGTIGNFIDDVRVVRSEVQEPATLALLGLGLAGLVVARRRSSAA